MNDAAFLRRAARLAVRGHGFAEPNPMVGCVLVRDGAVIAEGYHRRYGEAHAEAAALASAGERARDATAYVTLEPCNHHGRTPPCSDALIAAGIARVVYATSDPNPVAAGGAARLAAAGVRVERLACAECDELNRPFVKRVTSGLPWIMAKWAQTVDGRVATRSGDSKWVSSPRSRRMVHRERGRVDVVVTGFRTALVDDPLLTARHVRVRRVASRVVVDPLLALPTTLKLFECAAPPTIVAALPERLESVDADRLRERGIGFLPLGPRGELRPLFAALATEHGASNVLVEAGGGLLGKVLNENLLDEAWVFIAPILLADDQAIAAARGGIVEKMNDAPRWRTIQVRRRGDDVLIQMRR